MQKLEENKDNFLDSAPVTPTTDQARHFLDDVPVTPPRRQQQEDKNMDQEEKIMDNIYANHHYQMKRIAESGAFDSYGNELEEEEAEFLAWLKEEEDVKEDVKEEDYYKAWLGPKPKEKKWQVWNKAKTFSPKKKEDENKLNRDKAKPY